MSRMKSRLHASGIHLGISFALAMLMSLVVFGVWYPYPYRDASGGRSLFTLLVGVDVVMGPLITFMVFNHAKPRRELVQDLCVVGLLQLAALGYGFWTMYEARPVHMVFEYHRLSVVHAVDVDSDALKQAPPDLNALPLTGPTLLSLRPFKDSEEQYQSTITALGGRPQAAQPALWRPWAAARAEILAESHPVSQLKERFESQSVLIDQAVSSTGRPVSQLRYLPLITRKAEWTVLIDEKTVEPVGFLPLDSF